MTPHPYQREYLTAIAEGWQQFSKQLVVAPTGSGKGPMFAWTAEPFVKAGKRVLLLVDQDELVKQGANKFREILNIEASIEKAESFASLEAQVVVGSVQTLMREKRLERWPENHFGIVLADEADKSIAPSWMRVMKRFGGAKVCGYTATPWRTDQRNLGEHYENVIEKENLKSLIQKGFLSPIKIQQLPIILDVGSRGGGKDFTDDEADEIITPHLEEIAKAILQHCSFRRTLVFLPLIRTCEKFTAIARDVGLSSDYVYGEDPERHEKLQRFRNWDFDVLANSMLLTRGVDIPAVDAIVPCRPTQSVTLYFQMVGRGTRIAEGKADCLLLDFLYQATKRLICRPAHLIAKSPEEAEEMIKLSEVTGLPGEVIEQLDLIEVAAEASTVREEALKKKLEEQKNKKAKTISAAEFAMQHGSLEAAEFEPVMKWEQEKVSEKQAKYLAKAGIDIETVNGKGHASKLLSLYFPSQPLKLATFGQRQKMKQMGHPNWQHATAREAGQFFAQLNNNRKETQLI